MQEVLQSLSSGGYARAPQAALPERELHLERPQPPGARDVTQILELEVHHDGAIRDLRGTGVGTRGGGHLARQDPALSEAKVLCCLELVKADYEKEDIEPEPPRRRKKARRRMNPFIDAEAGVDGDASNDEGTDDENDDLD